MTSLLQAPGSILRGLSLLKSNTDDSEHVVPRSRFPCPYFELARRLMHEHLNAGDHFDSPFFRQPHS